MSATVSMLVAGQPHAGKAQFERPDPVRGEVATQAVAATVQDAKAAADAAAAAFPKWSITGPNERRALLMHAAASLEAKASEFVEAMMSETGATEGWVRFNLMLAAGMVREAASMTTQIGGETIP